MLTARTLRIAAWTAAAVIATLAAASVVLEIVGPAVPGAAADPTAESGGVALVGIQAAVESAFAVLGAIVVSRQPRNPVGWLLTLIGFSFMLIGVSYQLYLQVVLPSGDGSGITLYVLWLGNWSFLPAMVPAFILLPLLFPTGRPLTPAWRPLLWFVAVAATLEFAGTAFAPGPLGGTPAVVNPVGIDHPAVELAELVGVPCLLAAMLAGIASLVVRFRRSVGAERQQLKWVAAAVTLLPLSLTGLGLGEDASWPLLLIALLIVAVAVAVAMLRYRLYDIDVVISRTLLVAGLAAFISAAYVGIVVGVGSLVGGGDEPNLALSVLATAVVAVAFQPVRRGLQRVANRLVFGRRATPYDVLSGFATRVGAAEPSSDTLVQLAELMAGGTGADPARVWLRVGSQLRSAATWPALAMGKDAPAAVEVDGSDSGPPLPDSDLAVPVREQGELLGMLTIAKPRGERVTEIDAELLGRLAAASGMVLRNLRLDAELAQRLADLEASRRRLLNAQDDARQRIEAELAGGTRAQLGVLRERLAGLAREVDSVQTPKSALLLGQLVAATDGALDTLEGLAAGVYPPRLAADGLAAALTEQAAKAAVPVSVHAALVGRYPAEVEAAVYFSVLEALQNIAKYARASSARVRLGHDGDQLRFEVTDDGIGFDPATAIRGTGLQGMADRLDTVGATMTLTSAPGHGTTVLGIVPSAFSGLATADIPEPVAASR